MIDVYVMYMAEWEILSTVFHIGQIPQIEMMWIKLMDSLKLIRIMQNANFSEKLIAQWNS